ncbi:hypothetical protein CL659_04215 [bacterium]|nr:hypothetical protein [bacterium]|tara:strand:+ start:10823 stop:11896 length:1074 start_codon:yes stop_codon:yes gene_type:complete
MTKTAALIVTYNAPEKILKKLIKSIEVQEEINKILVVDNNSKNNEGIKYLKKKNIEIIEMKKNKGFSTAVNKGVKALSKMDYILLLNFDIILKKHAVKEMLKVFDKKSKIAGIAPKIYLYDYPENFDSVGTLIHPGLIAANRGIGQPDIGQFDNSEPVFGSCFGCTLLSVKALKEIGELWENFFLYYEDVDWCWRARMEGWMFMTAPKAEVIHHHSFLLKNKPSTFKYHYIQSNLLLSIVRLLEPQKAFIEIARRSKALFNRAKVEKEMRKATLSLFFRFFKMLIPAILSRIKIQKRRTVKDSLLFGFSDGHEGCFSDTEYKPIENNLPQTLALYQKWTLTFSSKYKKEAENASRRI